MDSVAPAGETAGGAAGEGTSAGTTATSSTEQAPQSTPAQAPQQHPPPSPLSGCYLLVVLPEPHTAQHKDLILNRLAKGFLSWDKDSCHVDLEKELQALVTHSPEGEEARNGERLIQYATENLVTEVLIYPQSNTLLQCIRNLLASFTKHRHIIHAGYTFGGNGSWILQDGTFSLADFLDAFSEHEVQRVLRAYENSVTVDIHCAGVGDWTTARLSKEACTRACRVRVNPDDVLTAGVPAITSFVGYIGQYLIPQTLDQLMEPSDVVGNIRFSHPTLYVFPGGQGDAALFGINGFNMLVDGGFARKACFWDFVRHLDRLDAVLVTRINNSNVAGMSSVIRKKKEMHVYPQIGHFFCNLIERKHSNSPDGDKDIDPLILNLIDVGQEMMVNLRHINLRPHPCYRDPEPINLYHKVGHGTLDMYVLSPSKDSREVREFMAKWSASDLKLFAGSHRKDSNSILFPVQNLVSICALLVWQPANPEDTITRILFPGSTPQHKIFEGFERLKHLEFLKRPVCTAKSLSPSTSLATLKEKATILKPKMGSIERETKRLAELRREKRDLSENKAVKKDSGVDDTTAKIPAAKPVAALQQQKAETKAKKVVENKKIESESKESKLIENGMKEIKRDAKKVEKSEETKKTDLVKAETEKTAPAKESKAQKIESKKKESKDVAKSISKPTRPDSTAKSSAKPIEKKPKPAGEKKDIMKPSPTTPKKSINGPAAAVKTEVTRTVSKTIKVSSKAPSAVPAKSAKDANNRMVVEQKNIELSSKSAVDSKAKPKTTATNAPSAAGERKPVARRPKPLSPSKARLPISPAKSAKSTPSSIKSEKDAVIRKIKGSTADSSAVSTPSGIDVESANKLIDRNLTEKSEDMSLDSIESKVLADLKEEREVVEEIEAVLQKAERIEGTRKKFDRDDELAEGMVDKKDDDVTEEDVTAELDDVPKKISRKESQELTEEDEYLIVEKEEIFTEDSVQSGDTEQKHHLDEVESEKTKIHVEHPPAESEYEEERDVDEKKDEIPEKKIAEPTTGKGAKKSIDLSPENKEILVEEMKQIIASATEAVQKDDFARKDSEDITKEPSTTSPEKVDSLGKQDVDQKETVPEKLEESQERISTLESGATTTAPTLPDDERVPLDEIKEEIEKHVSEDVKEKTIAKEKEILPDIPPIAPKPEVKVLDVKPPVQGIARDIVKTPDEVADLPVHEEVDPKLYGMEDLEKDKDIKMSPQETKESPPKDKGVFSFFGKVADKFEKGLDKLTKKARRDSEKDADDKSSKSSSPKEPKPQDKVLLEDVDMNEVFRKVGKHEEYLDPLEKAKQEISEAISGIDATTALLQEDIKESKLDQFGFIDTIQHVDKSLDVLGKEIKTEVAEDIEEVEAMMDEASKKFKNVKDSIQDSLESLEDKIDGAKKVALEEKYTVKDMLTGVAEKLEDIADTDIKEPEKVKFTIPESDDLVGDDEDTAGIVRDFKEAVRDVAEVLVGTAGIAIERAEKPKNVEEIVKKVAEVLKEDDFLSETALSKSVPDEKEVLSDIAEKTALSKTVFDESIKDVKDQVQEFLRRESLEPVSQPQKLTDVRAAIEEPFTKIVKGDEFISSPVKHDMTDLEEAKILCEDMLKDDIIKESTAIDLQRDTRADVMELGLEEVCVKEIAKREFYEEGKSDEEDKIVVEPEIGFQQNLSPGKAELVTVTPGSTPTSPKLATESEFPELSSEHKDMFNRETNLEDIIEEFIVQKKHKITMNIIEYIVIVKRVPKEKVIYIIQEIIVKHKIPRENVADRIETLRLNDDIPAEKRTRIENDIANEYLNKNRKINTSIVNEIAKGNAISQRIVIEIIEEIIVRKQFLRESVFDISDESYFTIMKEDLDKDKDVQKHDFLIDVSSTVDTIGVSTESIHTPISAEEVDDKLVDGFVNISSKDAVEAFLQQEKESSQRDDFEAVEQECKVQDGLAMSPKATIDDQKIKEIEEVSESISDVMEVDEKFVRETIEKSTKADYEAEGDKKDSKKDEEEASHEIDVSELSEADTKEKYLDEAKEKTSDHKELEKTVEIVDTVKSTDSPVVDHTKMINEEKDLQEPVSVKRMVVTASSEDGGQETEICPSGTITFTKAPASEIAELDGVDLLQKDTAQSPDSLQSEDASPAESVFSKSPTEKTSPHDLESALLKGTTSDKVFHKIEKIELTESVAEEEVRHEAIVQNIVTDKLISSSIDKEISKDKTTPEKVDDIAHVDKSKSPSLEKEIHEKDAIVMKPIDVGHTQHHDKEIHDRSKSPSAETEDKEALHEKSGHVDRIQRDSSRSPSAEKQDEEKELLSENLVDEEHTKLHDVDIRDRSKSPSEEKESHEKEASPKKTLHDEHESHVTEIREKSKSPSSERESDKPSLFEKSTDHSKPIDVDIQDRSKSPSVEKEASPKKAVHDEHESHVMEIKDKSKSPSLERESVKPILSTDYSKPHDVGIHDRSKSPSVEKELHEKEASLKKTVHDEHESTVMEIRDKSKSPSAEREREKPTLPEKPTDHSKMHDVDVQDKSKSPSMEKEALPKKTAGDEHESHVAEIRERSKSPSVEKKLHETEASPKKIVNAEHESNVPDIRDKSKSPSAERESEKSTLPEKSTDHSKPHDVDIRDSSKLPSIEKESHDKETSPKSTVHDQHESHVTEIRDKSTSPSAEKQSQETEASPKPTIHDENTSHVAEIREKSKSPSAERESDKSTLSQQPIDHSKPHDVDIKDRSKSTSVEKEVSPKKTIHDEHESHVTEIKDKSKFPSPEKESEKPILSEIPTDHSKPHDFGIQDRSKSPSVEKELHEKEASPKKEVHDEHESTVTEIRERSKSPSAEKELHEKDPLSKKIVHEDHESTTTKIRDNLKSPSAERESEKSTLPEKSTDHSKPHDVDIQDKSKSPSVEKESHEKETSSKSTVHDQHESHVTEIREKSKSPSAEKELHEKEASPKRTIHDEHTSHVTDVAEKSKSPSAERESEKLFLSEKSLYTDHIKPEDDEIKDRSKSPSLEKETHGKEASTEESSHVGLAQDEAAIPGRSKSPSVERDDKKGVSPEKSGDAKLVKPNEAAIKDMSLSPSAVEGEHEKEASLKPTDRDEDEPRGTGIDDKSKSPSVEREDKNKSPKAGVDDDHVKSHAEQDKSKSPSVEKESQGKQTSPKKSGHGDPELHATDAKERSKSPSAEREIEQLPLLDTSLDVDHVKLDDVELKDRSKSPSLEKEVSPKKSIDTIHAQRDVAVMETPSGKPLDADHIKPQHDQIKDTSKSPSSEKELNEKEASPERTVHDQHEPHLTEMGDKSISPSKEKEIEKLPLSDKPASVDFVPHDDGMKDREKSLSFEKDASPKKSIDIGIAQHEITVADRSKSPSVEREDKKESSPEKSVVTEYVKSQEAHDRSKSPSAEKEVSSHSTDKKDKTESPIEKSVDTDHVELHGAEVKDESKFASVEKPATSPSKTGSKSPSVEKETRETKSSPEKSVHIDNAQRDIEEISKSPSVLEDVEQVKQHKDTVKDSLKSPSVEKETVEKAGSPIGTRDEERIKHKPQLPSTEKEALSSSEEKELNAKDQSLIEPVDPRQHEQSVDSVDLMAKGINVKQDTVDFIHFEKVQYSSADSATDKSDRKQSTERSRSSSIATDMSKQEQTLHEKDTISEELKNMTAVSVADETKEKSKTPSVERDISQREESVEGTSIHAEARSKSPSSEKDVDRSVSVSKKDVDDTKHSISDINLGQHEDVSRSSSINADVTKDSESSSKSRSGSIQSVIDHGVSLSTSEKDKLKDAKSRTGSISESAASEARTHQSKSPSPEKVDVISEQYSDTFMEKARLSLISDKFDEDSLDRTKSPSVLSDRSDEKDTVDRSKSPSVAGDNVGQIDDAIKEHSIEEKPSAPSLSEFCMDDKHESEKSKSASPVAEKIHVESASSDRKASVTSVDSHTEDKGKDRSRSHSLFDAGDKTPLVRSRAASLYDDKLVEKVSLLEHGKDSPGLGKGIFEEENEFRSSSQEALDDTHKDVPMRGSIESDSPSAETKKAIENYILNEYINKNKVITLACINEITSIYKVDRYVVIKIVNELITSLKLTQEKIVEVDEDEHDEADRKLLDVEENLMNYINEEFVSKKKKINSNTIDEIASSKSVPRPLVILVIENIILSRKLRRESVVDFDLFESQDPLKKDMGADDPSSHQARRKPSAEAMPEEAFVEDSAHKSKSPSASPESGPSATAKSERPEPRIDEEITISEDKREEIESLIVDDYVDRGIKINEGVLENIIRRTSVPKYIIIEIIQEIIVKKLLSKNMVVDEIIFSDDDLDETPQKLAEQSLDKSVPYSTEYESPFHKAFMEGMTEIRTTHITTLSGKSTPDHGLREAIPDSSSEATSTITRTITCMPGKSEREIRDEAIGAGVHEDELSADRVVILKTTQITAYPEDEQETMKEFVQRQSLSDPLQTDKIEEEISSSVGSRLERDGSEQEIREIVTRKIVKTIITESEMDPITKVTKIVSENPSETTITTMTTATATSHSKVITEDKSSQEASSKTVITTTSVGDSGKSTPDIKREEQGDQKLLGSSGKDLLEQMEQSSISPLIRDLISDDRSYSGKSSPDVSLPKDIAYGDSTGKSTAELSMSPLIRDGTTASATTIQSSHFSGRSTPDKRSENKSRTATPEGFRSGEVIRTIITTTRTISDDGEFITTTQEVTETTNEKGETVVLATKTAVQVDEPVPADDEKDADKDPTSPRSDLSSGHSRAPTHMWESSGEERHTYSDEEQSSPLFSSSPHQQSEARPAGKEERRAPAADFSSSAMSSSFYGQLPEEVGQLGSTIAAKMIGGSQPEQDFTFRKLTVEKEYAGGYAEKDSKRYVDEADLDFEKALTTGAAAGGSGQQVARSGGSGGSDGKDEKDEAAGQRKRDPLAGWGSPLKLPSPKAPRKFNLRSSACIQPTSSADLSPDSLNLDAINDWGEPMRLPSPAAGAGNEASNKASSPGTPKKEREQAARRVMSENMKNKKRSESPSKGDSAKKQQKNAKNKVQPVYVDLTYVSHHGNSFYTALDFFKKVRARYYVFSGTEPSREVYDALLEAKKTWEDKDLEVTLIPTYDTDTLGYWVADNEEALAANHIDLSPSASRCTINLQDHETSCSAYRLEF